MDADGRVASVWEASQTRGPARRVYEITNAGWRALDDWIMGVGGLVEMLEACIAMHARLPTPKPAPRRKRGA